MSAYYGCHRPEKQCGKNIVLVWVTAVSVVVQNWTDASCVDGRCYTAALMCLPVILFYGCFQCFHLCSWSLQLSGLCHTLESNQQAYAYCLSPPSSLLPVWTNSLVPCLQAMPRSNNNLLFSWRFYPKRLTVNLTKQGKMDQCSVQGLAELPNSCVDLIVAKLGFEPPMFWVV